MRWLPPGEEGSGDRQIHENEVKSNDVVRFRVHPQFPMWISVMWLQLLDHLGVAQGFETARSTSCARASRPISNWPTVPAALM